MADRRSLFSRFWPPSASRRTPTTQTAAAQPPATTTRRKPESQSSSRTSPTSSPPPPRAETKTPVRQSTTKASSPPATAPAAPPRAEPRKASPEPSKSPAGELQTKDEPKTSSPSRAAARSPSSSKPASPSRLSAQSRSPPQPPSPSHPAPQARTSLPSPSRVTSQSPSTPRRTSKPSSPSRVTSRSPKQGSSSPPKGKQPDPASPSKDPTRPTLPNDPKTAEVKEEVKPDSIAAANSQTQEGTSSKHDDVEEKPSQAQGPETRETSKSLDSSTVNGRGHAPDIKLDAKPEETKDVKEVVQATKTEANDEKKKEVDDSVAPKSTSEAQIVEKPEILNEADQIHSEKQEAPDTKDILATPVDATASHPMKNSKSSGSHEHVPLQKKNIRADMSKFAKELAGGDHKKAISDRPVSVITLAGENRGASMHMESDSSKREGPIHIHRSYKSNPDQSPEAATTDGEDSSEGKKSEDERCVEDQVAEAYVNNNAQGINNSIVFNSSIVEGSPGVHMVVSHLPKEPTRSKDETNLAEARKAEVNMSRAEKLTYQPTIRRRCLRGLLLETSDSDEENPEKPRRHGCRVACQKGDREENNVDVL